jgi:uncharacterized protein
VLLLLPPSEGKARPVEGAPVDLASLAHADVLTPARDAALEALTTLAQGDPAAAREALGLSAGQADEVALDAGLRTAPAAPAAEVYTGVLFERLGLATLNKAARARAEERVLVQSALWGVVRPGDRIPAYRCSIGASLPGLPGLAAHWRAPLREALPDEGLVVDLRSGGYAAAWKPKRATHLAVRAFAVAHDGSRKPISHMAKAARGTVARALLSSRAQATEPRDVLRIIRRAGLEAELGDGTLDVLERA